MTGDFGTIVYNPPSNTGRRRARAGRRREGAAAKNPEGRSRRRLDCDGHRIDEERRRRAQHRPGEGALPRLGEAHRAGLVHISQPIDSKQYIVLRLATYPRLVPRYHQE